MSSYLAIIHKDKNSDYSVCFPDFPGCITAGDTVEDAYAMADEALNGHVDAMEEYGEAIPEPMTYEQAKKHAFYKGALLTFMVEVKIRRRPRSKRINIVLDEALIKEIDSVTRNRSAFLAEAARQRLHP